jgi:hypothetical protein
MFKILIATRQFLFFFKGGIFCVLSLGVAIVLLFYVVVYQQGISDLLNYLFPAKSDAPTSVFLYFFHSEYGGSRLFRNVSNFISFDTASYPLNFHIHFIISFFMTTSMDDNE